MSTAGVTIVDLLPDHVARLADIVRLNDPALPDMMRADVTRWLAAQRPLDERYFVALGPDGPVGMVGFRPDAWGTSDISWLVWLYLDPRWKRRGIASRLVHHAFGVLGRSGCRKVYLDVGNETQHEAAIAFHRSAGFVLEGHLKDYWRDGEDFLIFGRHL